MGVNLTVYYDGSCPICTASVRRFLAQDREGALAAVNTAEPGFDPVREGLVLEALGKAIQVKDTEGHVRLGVEGLLAVGRVLPRYRALAWFVGLPGIYRAACLFYRVFARNRHRFRWRKSCAEESCGV
ncbi:MAG: DUF393 domain-containing protein [Candidatus Omnitrophica bacterium]|nr:DUF393 domain-containing protein [Candidatus Omnitrophota bacterium]